MFKINFTVVFLNVYFISTVVYGAQIFAFVPIYGQSHWNVMDAVLQTLVSAGHNVTVITPFIKKEKIENYTQVSLQHVSYGKTIQVYNLLLLLQYYVCCRIMVQKLFSK